MNFDVLFIICVSLLFPASAFPTPPLLHHTTTPAPAPATLTQKDSEHAVAFSVGLTHTQHVTLKDRIVFDKVFVNKGNGYDKNSGIFICPVAGLYVFHIHAYDSNTDRAMWLELLHNDQVTVSVSGYNSHTSSGNTVMLNLNKYDRIEVKGRDKQAFSLFGLPDQVYSTLTGYLLVPTNSISFDPALMGVGR